MRRLVASTSAAGPCSIGWLEPTGYVSIGSTGAIAHRDRAGHGDLPSRPRTSSSRSVDDCARRASSASTVPRPSDSRARTAPVRGPWVDRGEALRTPIIYLCRTGPDGRITLFGHRLQVDLLPTPSTRACQGRLRRSDRALLRATATGPDRSTPTRRVRTRPAGDAEASTCRCHPSGRGLTPRY